MSNRDRNCQALLNERPDEAFWNSTSRGEVAAKIHARARELGSSGWSVGDRIALVPEGDLDTAVAVLAALEAGLSVLLLPRREPTAIQEHLSECAGARRLDAPAPEFMPPGERLPGTVWVRSSGSLGHPRWIIHTPDTLLAGATATATHLDFGPGARWRVSLPLDHVGGLSLIFRAIAGGGALTTQNDATHVSLVATQLRRLLDGGADLRGHRCVMLGGGPVPAVLRRRALAAGAPLVVSYGLTETGAVAAMTDLDEEAGTLCRDHFAGRPLFRQSLRVAADGEIMVGGPARCVALAGDDGMTAPVADAWLPTGDLGHLDGDQLHVTGRRGNLIISGGEKLPAEELEAALLMLEGVEDAVVVAVPDAEFGQRPAAFVQWSSGRKRSVREVREELVAFVAGWKCPVALWPMPAADGLKPDRAALQRLATRRLVDEPPTQS